MPLALGLNVFCGVIGGALAYLGLSAELLILILILMLADIVTGVIKVDKPKFNSRRLSGGFYSKAAGISIILAFSLFIKAGLVAFQAHPASITAVVIIQGGFLFIIAAGEFYSVARNIIAAAWKVEIPEWNIWVFLMSELRKRVENFFKKF